MSKLSNDIRHALKTLSDGIVPLCDELVKKHGSQRAAGDAIGVSYVHLNRIKKGHAQPSLEMIARMLSAL